MMACLVCQVSLVIWADPAHLAKVDAMANLETAACLAFRDVPEWTEFLAVRVPWELHDVLSPEFARVYSIVKNNEYEEFLQVISPWEREHLLLNV